MRKLIRSLAALALAGLLGLATPLASMAQEEQPEQPEGEQVDPSEERATAFRAVEGPVTEDVPGGTLLVVAYGIVWTLLLLYVFRLGAIQSGLGREVDRLERSLGAADAKGDDGGKD